MSAQKRDINLFKAAGGERAKARKRPVTSYLIILLLFITIGVIGAIVYLNINLKDLDATYQSELNVGEAYEQTNKETASLIAEYKAVVTGIYQAQKINQYLDIRRSRYTEATEEEVAAVEDAIINSNTAYSYALDVDLKAHGVEFLNHLDKTHYNYNLVNGALVQMIESQKKTQDSLWYTYYRGQMVVVFSGGLASGVNLEELANLLYGGLLHNGVTYEPFINININGIQYIDASYMAAAIDSETVYNVMLLTMKSIEERAIDILDSTSERLYQQAVISGNQDDFRYEIMQITYDSEDGALVVKVKIIESEEYTMKAICDDLHVSKFFRVSREVVSPPSLGEKIVDIILEIRDAYVGGNK